jgi:hypothetical protein
MHLNSLEIRFFEIKVFFLLDGIGDFIDVLGFYVNQRF